MYIAVFSVLIVIIDQLSKYWVRDYFINNDNLIIIKNYFYFTSVKNRGAAFGILEGQRIFFIFVTLFFIFFIFYIYNKELSKMFLSKLALIFLLGGSIANLIDRVVFSYVTDFIALDLFDFYQLPVINIADIFIFFGVIILIYQLFKIENRGV